MLVELRAIHDPRDRPHLAAVIDRAETLAATSLLPGHAPTSSLKNKLHLSYNAKIAEARLSHNCLI